MVNTTRRARYARKARRIPYAEWKAKQMAKKGAPRGYYGKRVGRYLGAGLGAYLGGPPGAALGHVLGGGVGALASRITGFGDYKVSKNAILHPQETPLFRPETNGNVVLAYREYLFDVISSATPGAFTANTVAVNPGQPFCFPWLSNIADNYQEWCPLGIVFEFVSNSADALNSTNTALGSICIASSYNPYDLPFQNKQQMEQSFFSNSCRPSSNLMHALECDPVQTRPVFNIRQSDVPTGADRRLYDLCNTTIATVGMQGTSVNVGELWITYMIELRKAHQGETNAQHDHLTLTTGVTTAAYFGTGAAKTARSNMGLVFGATTIRFPNSFFGNVCVFYSIEGDVGAWIDPILTGTVGAAPLSILQAGTQHYIQSSFLATDDGIQVSSYWTITGGGLITFSSGTLPTNSTLGDCIVSVLPRNMD